MKQFLKEKKAQLFDGEITLLKTDFWLVAGVIFLLGVLYGLLKAPLTHGITISCGNNNIAKGDSCECICRCEEDDDVEDDDEDSQEDEA